MSDAWDSGECFLVARDGPVLVVTLNRPEKLNAFSRADRIELAEFWGRVRADADVRCVIVTGAGRGFQTGADVSGLAGPRSGLGDGLDDELAFLPGRRIEVPVVVAVNGVCAGGGLHWVADADIVIAGQSASFLDSHVNVGQVTGIEPASLALRMPVPAIARMVLVGSHERIGAEQALQLGLVTEVVADEELLPRARQLGAWIAAASPAALRISRRLLRELEASIVEPAMAKGWDAVMAHWPHPDVKEGPTAFAEKREPRWADP